MKAPEVPPLLVRASDQLPKRIAGRLSKLSRWSEIGADFWVMYIVQWGVQDPLCNAAPTERDSRPLPQGVPKWSSLNQSVQELRNKGAIEPAPLTQAFTAACHQGNMGVEADHGSILPQCLRALPELHYGDASVNPRGPATGPVVNFPKPERCLLSYRDRPSGQTLLTLLSQRHCMAIHSTAIRAVNQSESIYQNTQIGTSIYPSPSGKIAHVPRRLVVKPRDTPGSSRANILAQVPVPKARVGLKPREIGSNPISGCHLSGDRAGHSCRPGKAITQEVDQLAIRSGGIHGTAVTTWCPVAPSTWTPSLFRETSTLWLNSHSSQLRLHWAPSSEKSSKPIPLDLQSRRAIIWWTNGDNLRRGSPNRDHGCGVLPVHRQQYPGLGAHLQKLTASGIWSQDQSQFHINVLELQAIILWLGLKAFSQRVENAKVALMSDNTSAVAYLRNQGGGTKSLAMSDLATDICLWSEKRGMTLIPRHLPGHLNVLADHHSVPEGSNPQDRMEPKPDHSR